MATDVGAMRPDSADPYLIFESPPPTRLVVFSDDWGRHPSSCQHLIRGLLKHNPFCCPECRAYQVLWVNTLGTRMPQLTRADLAKVMSKLKNWAGSGTALETDESGQVIPRDLTVIDPRMWPGFRRSWQRRLNAAVIQGQVNEALGHRRDEERVAVTTLPITADLVGRVDVDRWVYYCVDDFSTWPGLDHDVMQAMERELVQKVDEVIVVSKTLQQRMAGMGRDAQLLTHGIDLKHWRGATDKGDQPVGLPDLSVQNSDRPVVLFWGLIDRRLDITWCKILAEALAAEGGTLILAGPQQAPDPALHTLPNTQLTGPVAYDDLPAWAAASDVLVMPYMDAEVTRAMQPLKLKEYLATGKPVVVRNLPSTQQWCDAADVVGDMSAFVDRVMMRAKADLPASQIQARQRLSEEAWANKATQFASLLAGTMRTPVRSAA